EVGRSDLLSGKREDPMRVRMVLLFVTAMLALAGVSTASADNILYQYGKITYSNGSPCAPSLCTLIIQAACNQPCDPRTKSANTQSLTNLSFTGNSYPDNNWYVVNKPITYNVLVPVTQFFWNAGVHMIAQAREP